MFYWTSDLLLHGWAPKQRFTSLLSLGNKHKDKGNPQGNEWLSQKRLLLHTPAFVAFKNSDTVFPHAVPHSQPLNNTSQKLLGQHSLLRLHKNASYFLNAFDFLRGKARSTPQVFLCQNSPTWRQLIPSSFFSTLQLLFCSFCSSKTDFQESRLNRIFGQTC